MKPRYSALSALVFIGVCIASCADDALEPIPPPGISQQCSELGTCLPLEPPDDGNPCTIDECDKCGHPVHRPAAEGLSCGADGSCIIAAGCQNGVCVGKPLEDGSPCISTDACAPLGACFAGECFTEPPPACKADQSCNRGVCFEQCSGSSFSVSLPFESAGTIIAAGNINGDSATDLIIAGTTGEFITTLLNQGSGLFVPFVHQVGPYPQALAAADFNGDGLTDIALGHWAWNSLNARLNDGSGAFPSQDMHFLDSEPYSIAAGDVNGDGFTDLVVGEIQDKAAVFINDGSGSFAPLVSFEAGYKVTLADINGDMHLDIVAVTHAYNAIRTLLNKGDGTFDSMVEYPMGGWIRSITTGHINADGFVDLIYVDFGFNVVGVRLNNGDGTFGSVDSIDVGKGPDTVIVTDVDADGWLDIVVSTPQDSAVRVLRNVPSDSFEPARNYGMGSGFSPAGIIATDIDGDGKTDIAAVSPASQEVQVFLSDCLRKP